MEDGAFSGLMWSSCQRSVPDVSLIKESNGPVSTNGVYYSNNAIKTDFPLSSSPPLREIYQKSPSQYTLTKVALSSEFELLKAEIMAAIKQNCNCSKSILDLALHQSEFLANIKRENMAVVDEFKRQIVILKEEIVRDLAVALKKEKDDMSCLFNKLSIDVKKDLEEHFKTQTQQVEQADQEVQTSLMFKDAFTQVEVCQDAVSDEYESEDDENNCLVLNKSLQHRNQHPRNQKQEYCDGSKAFPIKGDTLRTAGRIADYPEGDELHFSEPSRLPAYRCRDEVPERECQVAGLVRRGTNKNVGFGRIQELRMEAAARQRKQQYANDPSDPASCSEVSMTANAVLAKYLSPEKLAECQSPRHAPTTPAQDVVFNMTNVSFAMRYPAERDHPPGANPYKMYSPPVRPHPQNRYYEDRAYRDELDMPAIADRYQDWMQYPQREERRTNEREQMGVRLEDDGWERGIRRGQIINEDQDWVIRQHPEPEWGPQNGRQYPADHGGQGWRGQYPRTDRILDTTAIMNQPKLI